MLISDDNNNQPYFNPQFNDNNFIISLFRMVFAIDCGLVTKLCPTLVTSQTVAFQGPLSKGSPSKDTGVGCHSLLQGIFLTQGLNSGLLHCRKFLYQLSYQGSPQGYLLLFEDK